MSPRSVPAPTAWIPCCSDIAFPPLPDGLPAGGVEPATPPAHDGFHPRPSATWHRQQSNVWPSCGDDILASDGRQEAGFGRS